MTYTKCLQQYLVHSKHYYFLLVLEIILVPKKIYSKSCNLKQFYGCRSMILPLAYCPLKHWETQKAWDIETTAGLRCANFCPPPPLHCWQGSLIKHISTLKSPRMKEACKILFKNKL